MLLLDSMDSMDALGNFLVGFLGLCGWVGGCGWVGIHLLYSTYGFDKLTVLHSRYALAGELKWLCNQFKICTPEKERSRNPQARPLVFLDPPCSLRWAQAVLLVLSTCALKNK